MVMLHFSFCHWTVIHSSLGLIYLKQFLNLKSKMFTLPFVLLLLLLLLLYYLFFISLAV